MQPLVKSLQIMWPSCGLKMASPCLGRLSEVLRLHEGYGCLPCQYWGTAVAQWLRSSATNWKVAGSIPAGVIGIFHLHKSDRTMALGSTQPLTEMSTRSIFLG